jgi:hypothetical protein
MQGYALQMMQKGGGSPPKRNRLPLVHLDDLAALAQQGCAVASQRWYEKVMQGN